MVSLDSSDTMKNKILTCDNILLSTQQELDSAFDSFVKDDVNKWGMTSYIHSLAGFNHKIHLKALR